jgi:hypothetical protein
MRPNAFIPRRASVPRTAAVLLAALLGMPPVACAQDTQAARATLRGVKAVEVQVGNIDPDAERDGLSRSQLQSDVESRLRQAGITMRPSSEGILYVSVTAARGDLNIYAYSLQVAFRQAVNLARDPTIGSVVTTWSVGSGGTLSAAHLSRVRSIVTELVDQFISAYLEENPTK